VYSASGTNCSERRQKVLIITHAGVIRLILQAVLQFPLENMFNIQIDYGKKVILEVNEGYFFCKK
jgi:alpha-ribazole phosphatase